MKVENKENKYYFIKPSTIKTIIAENRDLSCLYQSKIKTNIAQN